MTEYSSEQRSKLSRVIANNGGGSKQLKGFVDNRMPLKLNQINIPSDNKLSKCSYNSKKLASTPLNTIQCEKVMAWPDYDKGHTIIREDSYNDVKQNAKEYFQLSKNLRSQTHEMYSTARNGGFYPSTTAISAEGFSICGLDGDSIGFMDLLGHTSWGSKSYMKAAYQGEHAEITLLNQGYNILGVSTETCGTCKAQIPLNYEGIKPIFIYDPKSEEYDKLNIYDRNQKEPLFFSTVIDRDILCACVDTYGEECLTDLKQDIYHERYTYP